MPCKGNSAETCGGPNRLNLYRNGSGSISSCPATQATTSSGTTLATSASVSSTMATSMSSSTTANFLPSTSVTSGTITTTNQTAISISATTSSTSSVSSTTTIISTTVVSTSSTATSSSTLTTITSSSTVTTIATSSSPLATTSGAPTTSANLVKNSDFSAGLANWTPTVLEGTVTINPITNGNYGYNSPSALYMDFTSSFYSTREAVIKQTITGAVVGQKYDLTFYQGRSSNAYTDNSPSIIVGIGNNSGPAFTACVWTGCPLTGEGTTVYRQVMYPFTATATSLNLVVEVVWTNHGVGFGILLSDFSIVPVS